MRVNKSFETEEGTVKFEGELNSEELDAVLKVGLNVLLQTGFLPFVRSDIQAEPEQQQ